VSAPAVVGVDPAAPRPEVGFRLHVPDEWLTLDLDPATSDGWVEGVLDARIAEHPAAARHRGHMRRVLQALIEQQRGAGVFLAAVLAAAGERPADLIGASLSLTWTRLTSPPQDVEWLARFLQTDQPADGEQAQDRTVEVVDLPAGPAVRVRTSLLTPIPESSRRQRVAVNQVVVPVLDTPWLGTIVVSSPNLDLAEVFAALADEVAQSLVFLDPATSDPATSDPATSGPGPAGPAADRPTGRIGQLPAPG
jgi:hypothetical protein